MFRCPRPSCMKMHIQSMYDCQLRLAAVLLGPESDAIQSNLDNWNNLRGTNIIPDIERSGNQYSIV